MPQRNPDSRFSFSKRRLEALPAPATGRAYAYDAGCRGLAVAVTAQGAKTFYRCGRVQGRPQRVLLGKFPEMTVEQARKACQAASAAIAGGRDLQAERQAARHEHTLVGLYGWWLECHAKAHKRTWKEDARMYDTFLKPWANRRLSAIRKTDVQALHAKIGRDNGPYAANRVLGFLKAMYAKADAIGYSGANPAAGVKRFAEQKRDRFLRADELPVFLQALQTKTTPTVRDFFLLALLTGARRGNVQAMRWEEIDFDAGLWRIPETKSGRPVVLPLVGPALAILHERHKTSNGCPWVFPTWSRTGHLVEPKRAWQRVCTVAGIDNLRFHDVRRTLGSWLAMTGAALPIVGKMLGHTTPSATAVYARLEVAPVRLAAETATAAIMAAGAKKPHGDQDQDAEPADVQDGGRDDGQA